MSEGGPGKGVGILAEMLGLPAHRPLEPEAEPGQVVLARCNEFRPASGDVDILYAQQEPPPKRTANASLSNAE